MNSWEEAIIKDSTNKGVRYNKGRFEATVSRDGSQIYLGSFLTADGANKAVIDYKLTQFRQAWIAHKLTSVFCAVILDKYVAFENGMILNLHGKIIHGGIDRNGYREVTLSRKQYRVHRVIAEVFLPHIPGKFEVNHIDGNKLNNDVRNLEWVTRSENIRHAYENDLERKVTGELHHNHKLNWDIVQEIRLTYIRKDHQFGAAALARKYHVNRSTIEAIINNETWRAE